MAAEFDAYLEDPSNVDIVSTSWSSLRAEWQSGERSTFASLEVLAETKNPLFTSVTDFYNGMNYPVTACAMLMASRHMYHRVIP